VFTGPTVLARAFRLLEDGGYPCAVVSAPDGGSPCGLAVAVRERDRQSILAVLQALGAAPTRAVSSEPGDPDAWEYAPKA